MAKKKRSEKHIHLHHVTEIKQTDKSFSFKDLTFLSPELGLILLITVIAYLTVFKAGFVWDDTNYVQNNHLIRSLDLGSIFSNYVMGNYHPLTVLAFAMEYKFFGLNATGYHIINLLLHLANVLLVYYALLLL